MAPTRNSVTTPVNETSKLEAPCPVGETSSRKMIRVLFGNAFFETHSIRVKILNEASRAWLPSLWPLESFLLGNPSRFDIFHGVLQLERTLNHRVRVPRVSMLVVSTPPQRPTIHNHAILMKFSLRKQREVSSVGEPCMASSLKKTTMPTTMARLLLNHVRIHLHCQRKEDIVNSLNTTVVSMLPDK